MSLPVRIQITLYHKLQAEVICEYEDVDYIWAAFTQLKYKRGLEFGGAVVQRADLPRVWNVPVGSEITEDKTWYNGRYGR